MVLNKLHKDGTNVSLTTLSQSDYATKVLEKYGFDGCAGAWIPMEPMGKSVPETSPKRKFPYREILGSLQYLACKTRPDLAFSVNYCSRYVENHL